MRLLIGLFKLSFFAVLVLVLSHWIKWDGRTISDQVRSQMSHPEKILDAERVRVEKFLKNATR